MSEKSKIELVEANSNFKKRSVEDILKDSENVRPDAIADEVLIWLIDNVESYVDSKTKAFKIDLIFDNSDGMQETKKLQDLYRAIPDDPDGEEQNELVLEKCQKCRRILDNITKNAYENMRQSNEALEKLFKRMVYFYEKIIPNPDNKKLAFKIDEDLKELLKRKETAKDKKKIQQEIVAKIKEGEKLIKFEELEGAAEIIKFDYEAFNVGVELSSKPTEEEIDKGKKSEVFRKYNIPESFTVWIQIVIRHKQRPTVMF